MRLLLTSLWRFALLTWQTVTSPVVERRRIGGSLLMLFGLPLFILWQLLHWLGFLFDEILFRGYRKVAVQNPLFILGPPRSGTTHLHHLLSGAENTTTFRTWECLFALSISGRKLCLGLARVDRLLGRPLGKLIGWGTQRFLGAMDSIHPFSLDGPEEDFLCLLPLADCFALIVPFPRANWLWKSARFDVAIPPPAQRALMRYYRRCIQKHLYVFGTHKRFLSKNASFTGMAEALLTEFPHARILATTRDPLATVPSQLSALRPALRLCGFPQFSTALRDRFIDLLAFYYAHLDCVAARHPGRVAIILNSDLRERLAECVLAALQPLGIDLGKPFVAHLEAASAASRQHQSNHHYALEDFALDAKSIRSRFSAVDKRHRFDRSVQEHRE